MQSITNNKIVCFELRCFINDTHMSFTGGNQIHHCSKEQAKPMTETPKAILGDQSDDQSRIQLIASKDIAALGSYLVSDSLLSTSANHEKWQIFFVENMPHNYAVGLP